MSEKRSRRAPEITPADFPALRDFVRGYFHQDLADEYGSPEAAARQFCHDADTEQRKAVAEEWRKLRNLTKSQPLAALNETLQKTFGSSLLLAEDDVEKISAIFAGR